MIENVGPILPVFIILRKDRKISFCVGKIQVLKILLTVCLG